VGMPSDTREVYPCHVSMECWLLLAPRCRPQPQVLSAASPRLPCHISVDKATPAAAAHAPVLPLSSCALQSRKVSCSSNQSINQSINQPTNQPTNQTTNTSPMTSRNKHSRSNGVTRRATRTLACRHFASPHNLHLDRGRASSVRRSQFAWDLACRPLPPPLPLPLLLSLLRMTNPAHENSVN